MSMAIVRWFQDNKFMYDQLSIRERATFTQIAIYCSDDGYPFYTMNRIADQIGQTSGHFSRDAKKLFELGLLVRDGRSFRISDMCIGEVRHRLSSLKKGDKYVVVDEVTHEYDGDCYQGGSNTATKVVAPDQGDCYQGGSNGCYQGGSNTATKVVAPVPYNTKEEKNKKRVNACACACDGETPISDAQAAHLGCSVSARPNRNVTGKPEERVKVVVARPTSEHSTEAKDKASLGAFIKEYPKRAMNRFAVCAEWANIEAEGIAGKRILAAMREAKMSKQWCEDGRRYVPRAENFLKDRVFEDFLPQANERASVKTQEQRDADENAEIKKKYEDIEWMLDEEI